MLAAYGETSQILPASCAEELSDFTSLMASAIANAQARETKLNSPNAKANRFDEWPPWWLNALRWTRSSAPVAHELPRALGVAPCMSANATGRSRHCRGHIREVLSRDWLRAHLCQ